MALRSKYIKIYVMIQLNWKTVYDYNFLLQFILVFSFLVIFCLTILVQIDKENHSNLPFCFVNICIYLSMNVCIIIILVHIKYSIISLYAVELNTIWVMFNVTERTRNLWILNEASIMYWLFYSRAVKIH